MTTPKDKSQEGPYSYWWRIYLSSEEPCILECERLNAAYAAGRASQWISVEEKTPDGDVLLAGPAYNNPATGEYWQRVGFYSNGMLYANDEFDPWEGYPPTHWMPLPAPPSNT